MTVLLREAIGDRLRHARTNQQRTLREVSRSARVSLGYLSEVERGRKEASSELLAAICDALELPLSELLHTVASDIGALTSVGDRIPEPAVGDRPAPVEPGVRASVADNPLVVPAVLGDTISDLRIQPVLTTRIDAPVGAGAAVFAA